MKYRQSDVKSRQNQPQNQGPIPQYPQKGCAEIVPAPVLRAFHEITQIRGGKIAQRQAIHQQPYPSLQKPGTEFIRPLGILDQWESRLSGASNVFLHGGGRQEAVHVDLFQTAPHPLDQRFIRQPLDVGHGHIGQGSPSHLGLPEPQLRGAQMAANQAGIGADGLHEGILGAFDGILHLRGGNTPLFPGLDLEGNGSGSREQDHAEAVDQLPRHRIQILARVRHAVIDVAQQRLVIERPGRLAGQIVRNGAEHIFRGIPAGGQAVDGVGIEPNAVAPQGTLDKIPRALENFCNVLMIHFPGIQPPHLPGRIPQFLHSMQKWAKAFLQSLLYWLRKIKFIFPKTRFSFSLCHGAKVFILVSLSGVFPLCKAVPCNKIPVSSSK